MKKPRQSDATLPKNGTPIERRPISGLRPHPDQDALFRPRSDEEVDRLARSMRRGLDHPIEITADGMIIDGHERVRAARRLGWEEIDVKVRNDLEDRSAIDHRHIDANENRRQLDLLDRVRLAVRTLEIEKKRARGGLGDREAEELRERVGRLVGHSGRHAQRYINVAQTPMEVQRAFSDGRLPMTLAEKVRRLPKAIQREIADEIRGGVDPIVTVKAHLPARATKAVDLGRVLGRLVGALEAGMDALSGREHEIRRHPDDLTADIRILKRFSTFSRDLRPILRRRRDESRARSRN